MHVTRMHDVEIDRYPTISTSACVRSGLTRRPRPPETAASQPDAERYVHTVRDLMVPMGDIEVGIGTSSMSSQLPKRSIFAPRGAFGRGRAMFTGGRNRDPMPSGTPTPFPHTMRGRPDHRSASAVPVLTVGAGGRNV